jgi:hypothetical protein
MMGKYGEKDRGKSMIGIDTLFAAKLAHGSDC